MNAKQYQIGKLRAACLELERRHSLAVWRAKQARANNGPDVDAAALWEAGYAAKHRALTDAMSIILTSDDGDKAAYDKAMEAQA